jgi:hypothetical protein
MPGPGARAERTRPFLAQRLAVGSESELARFPATFSVHDEDGVFGLYISPVDLGWLASALALPPGDRAVLVDGHGKGRSGTTVPWSSLAHLTGEVELVHLPADRAAEAPSLDLPIPLLADPGRVLSERVGSRVAVSLQDNCHAVVLTREPELLSRCVGAFIAGFIESNRPDNEVAPTFDPALVAPFVDPIPDDSWLELDLDTSRRFWTLSITEHGEDQYERATRWVSEGPNGRWRAGWSW